MAGPERYTTQGWEWQFATNHLGHFALATGLHAALAADGAAQIVAVSSSGHQISPVVFDDVSFAFRPYDPWLAYGQSKTANVLFALEATRRWSEDGITANALMPGAIYTNLQRHTGGRGSGKVPPELIKTVEQGAATAVAGLEVVSDSTALDQVELWRSRLDALLMRAGEHVFRREARTRLRDYVKGVLAQVGRKNTWQIAEYVGHATPDGLQRLLAHAVWDPERMLD